MHPIAVLVRVAHRTTPFSVFSKAVAFVKCMPTKPVIN